MELYRTRLHRFNRFFLVEYHARRKPTWGWPDSEQAEQLFKRWEAARPYFDKRLYFELDKRLDFDDVAFEDALED